MAAKRKVDPSINYKTRLTDTARRRYEEKIIQCGNIDPYELKDCDLIQDLTIYPSIQHGDISNYLIHGASYITNIEMKAYKSLEGHVFFTSGWVHAVKIKRVSATSCIAVSMVNHSQSLNVHPHKVWILCQTDGAINTAHCTCMAGLGEACSHIAAVLFAIDYLVRKRDETSCTSLANVWLPPTIRTVPQAKISEIDFTSAKAKRNKISSNAVTDSSSHLVPKLPSFVDPTEEQISEFRGRIFESCPNSSALIIDAEYIKKVRAKPPDTSLPPPLNSLYKDSCVKLNFADLLIKSRELFRSFHITNREITEVQLATQNQSKSEQWFDQRSGRCVASKMKSYCCSDPHKPSISLILNTCYPQKHQFTSRQTEYGCNHEKIALEMYGMEKVRMGHINVTVNECGFYIHKELFFIGGTPDAIVICDCCGIGVVEIKCPYCLQHGSLEELIDKKGSFLTKISEEVTLKKNHQYYYQVQTQLLVVPDATYCDFVVYSGNEKEISIFTVLPDIEFQTQMVDSSEKFFYLAILPEITATYFSRPSVGPPTLSCTNERTVVKRKICYCKEVAKNRPTVHCSTCTIGTFHKSCLDINDEYKANNYICPDCHKKNFYSRKATGQEN